MRALGADEIRKPDRKGAARARRARLPLFEGGIISSVVPQVTELCRSAAEKVIKKPVKVVGPGESIRRGKITDRIQV